MIPRSQFESVARDWISLWTAPVDWALFDQVHDDDFEDCSSAGRSTTKAAFAQALTDFIRAFPDIKTTVEGLVIDESEQRVAVRWSAIGTNRTAYMGTGPTNRITLITGIEIIEIKNGRIMRRWGEWDITAHTQRQ